MPEIDNSLRTRELMSGANLGVISLPSAAAATTPSVASPGIRLGDAGDSPPAHTCQQTLTLSFFFDGTGNNLDADIATVEHSNVARLYRAHVLDNPAQGRFRFYLPGIGTLFKDREVNDPGGTLWGRAFGDQGASRLQWALARLQEKVLDAEKRAENPTNKICWIKVAAFGFSRGAALARAFCRDLQKLCDESADSPTGWRMRQGRHQIEITFLGLFDTVASAGLPPSANNALRRSRRVQEAALTANPLIGAIGLAMETPELKRLAFGAPGADPAPGLAAGHQGWADGMRIATMVSRCAHMIAAHENRNSFACDSALFESSPQHFRYPSGTTEMLYPGVHSDVGGGYRPGEGGCRKESGAQLSLIPLRAMHAEASQYVPLVPFSSFLQSEREDFALDPEGARHFAHMADLFMNYRQRAEHITVPGATHGLGGQVNGHMRLYYAWRFYRIRRGSAAHGHEAESSRDRIDANESQFKADRAALDRKLKLAVINLSAAQAAEERLGSDLQEARTAQARYGTPVDPTLSLQHEAALRSVDVRQAEIDRIQALRSTAADDSKLGASIARYDHLLVRQARQIVEWMRKDTSLTLRPHYAALIEAYRDEYERGKGLDAAVDAKLIELFDDYVHDSMAGFDSDASWPSDPRIIYVGGDSKLRYAIRSPEEADLTEAA